METEPGTSESKDGVHTFCFLNQSIEKPNCTFFSCLLGQIPLIVSDSFVGRWYFVSLPSVLFVKPQGPIICGKLQDC